MVDGPDPGPDRGVDPLGGMSVRRDLTTPARGFGDRRLDLGVGVLLCRGGDSLREHRSGGEDLDEVGAVLEVRAHRFDDLVGSVGEVAHDRHVDVDRELPRVSRASRRSDVVPRDHHARSRDHSGIDGVSERDVDVGPGRAHVAAGREARHQRHQRVSSSVERRVRRRRFQKRLLPVHVGAVHHVRVEVDETGEEGGRAEIDNRCSRRNREVLADLPDSIALDDDRRRLERLASTAVDQAARTYHGDLGLGRSAENQGGDASSECFHRDSSLDGEGAF